jgi:hypothetical protein
MTIEIFDLELPPEEPVSNQQYTTHRYFTYFASMVNRAKKGTMGCDFSWGLNNFNRWLDIIGTIPEGSEESQKQTTLYLFPLWKDW